MMDLTPGERASSTWLKVTKHIEETIELLRAQWEGATGQEAPEIIRGRVLACRAILKAGDEAPYQEPPLPGDL